MKKLAILLPDEAHKRLKEYAEKDRRSLHIYLQLWLTWLAANPYQPAPSPLCNPEIKEMYEIEEGK